MNILFVCLGNICRSPLAEAVFAQLVAQEGLSPSFHIDSAGTASYHQGELADPRSRACASRRGVTLTHRARGVVEEDFHRFDVLVAMDQSNATELRRRAPSAEARKKVHLLREWDPVGPGEVPDPYYGGDSDFETVWHLCERSCPGFLQALLKKERR